jgi:dihydroorotase-like cyclic amidohydrolase
MIELPGLIDCHVHFRVPGQEYKEDWITGSAAALAGGVTGVVDMPSNMPAVLTGADLTKKRLLIAPNAVVEFRLPLGVTDLSVQQALAAQTEACAFKVFLQPHSTGMWVKNDATLHTLFQDAAKPIMIHDDSGVDRILPFVQQYKKPTYFCHVSRASELAAIAAAKQAGLPVYAEVTLHHLWLDATNHTLGPRAKVNPPLRTAADRKALWQGIRDGVVDTIATDHAPHTLTEKDSAAGAAGFPSIEFFVPLLFTGVAQGRITVNDIIRCCVTNPTKLFDFTGPRGTVVVDPVAQWTITAADIKSKCGWSPYVGFAATGRVVSVSMA